MGKPWLLALVLVAVAVSACSSDDKKKSTDTPGTTPGVVEDDDTTFAEDGTDSNATDTDAQLVASSLVSPAPGMLGLADLGLDDSSIGTRDVGDAVKAVYFPRTCVSGAKTANANEAKYTFDKCLGPNGLVGLTGSVIARYTLTDSTLRLDLTYDATVNNATLQGSATAEITANGANRSMTWTATLTGNTARKKDFSFQSNHTVTWSLGDSCFSLDGTEEGQVAKRDIKTDVKGFRRCGRGCPENGGEIDVTNVAKNKVVSLTYDGSNVATYKNANGKQTDVPLLCKP